MNSCGRILTPSASVVRIAAQIRADGERQKLLAKDQEDRPTIIAAEDSDAA